MKLRYLIPIVGLLAVACNNDKNKSDAYGTFEATEVTISSEANGKIISFCIEEGQSLPADTVIGQIDTLDLSLKRQALIAQRKAIATKQGNISSQIDVQQQQKENLLIEKNRIVNLLKDKAATPKQLDDINASIRLVDKQMLSIQTQSKSIPDEMESLTKQIAQLTESIRKCTIRNPISGEILTKYSEPMEMTTIGKALYKIADMNQVFLRVYVDGTQLPSIKLGQKVEVLVDKDKKDNRKLEGTISWVSQTAEFTPKIIQTKEERVNLVYAVKVLVKNDGTLKIGMPGEVNFK